MSEIAARVGPRTELDSIEDFDARIADAGNLAGCWVQSLDLTRRGGALAGAAVDRTVFLGCTFAPGVEAELEARGALVFPMLPDLPFNPYRTGL